MANITILDLPVRIAMDGTEQFEVVAEGSSWRVGSDLFSTIITGFVPTTRAINTTVGIIGGGTLATDLDLSLSVNDLSTKAAMVIADSFAINDVAGGNISKQTTFPNAMKATSGLTALAIPDLTLDFMPIYHAADGLVYKVSPSAMGLAAGNVPAGGTTGQVLIKNSGTNYDTVWSAINVAGGGTGQTTLTNHGVLIGAGTSPITQLAVAAAGTLLGGVAASDPAFTATPTLGIAGTTKGTLSLAGNTSGTVLLTPQAAAGTPTITFGTSSGTPAVTASAPLAISAATGNISITGAAGQILAGATPAFTATPTLGVAGTTKGTLSLCGNTSGTVLITPQAAAGSITLTLPNTAGTIAASATAPITLNATTGAIGITGAALTKTDDTNVTLTLGGAPTTALLAATSLTLGWTGTLAATRGGTGLAAGTSGGINYWNSATTMASSALLTASAIVFGGGAGVAPATGLGLGTTSTVLHGNAAGLPTWGAVSLTADVSGDLPFANIVQVATASILGRTTAGTGDIEALTGAQATALLSTATVGGNGTANMASAANYWANTSTVNLALSPAQVWTAAAFGTLTDAATIAVDMSTFINASVLLTAVVGATRALGAPSNAKPGQSGCIKITQSSGGSNALTYNSAWVFTGGVDPTLSTAANAIDLLFYFVISSGVIYAQLNKAIA